MSIAKSRSLVIGLIAALLLAVIVMPDISAQNAYACSGTPTYKSEVSRSSIPGKVKYRFTPYNAQYIKAKGSKLCIKGTFFPGHGRAPYTKAIKVKLAKKVKVYYCEDIYTYYGGKYSPKHLVHKIKKAPAAAIRMKNHKVVAITFSA